MAFKSRCEHKRYKLLNDGLSQTFRSVSVCWGFGRDNVVGSDFV